MVFRDLTEKDIPKQFLEQYHNLKSLEEQFIIILTAFQDNCPHEWEKIMEYNSNYSPRVDGLGVGGDVLVGWRCKPCNAFKPRPDKLPFNICYKCGGKMKLDHSEYCGQDRVFIHKCVECGHEYDTT